MKKFLYAAIALLSLQAIAQDRPQQKRHPRMESLKKLSPEQMAELQTKRLTLDLDLTDAQQKEIQKINLEHSKTLKAKMDEREKKVESDEPKKLTDEERYEMMNDKLDKQIQYKRQMKSILTPDQYNKWESLREEKMKRAKHAMHKKQKH